MAMLEAFVPDPLINWRLVTEPKRAGPIENKQSVPVDEQGSDEVDFDNERNAKNIEESAGKNVTPSSYKHKRPQRRRKSASTIQMQMNGGLSRSTLDDSQTSL